MGILLARGEKAHAAKTKASKITSLEENNCPHQRQNWRRLDTEKEHQGISLRVSNPEGQKGGKARMEGDLDVRITNLKKKRPYSLSQSGQTADSCAQGSLGLGAADGHLQRKKKVSECQAERMGDETE